MTVASVKRSASAFFISVGTLGLLHFLFGWPAQQDDIWVPALCVGAGALAVQFWRQRGESQND